MKPPCKSAAEALTEGPVAGLIGLARLLDQISATVDAVCRELAQGEESFPAPRCTLQASTVVITVGTPSHAAKLRQRASQLTCALRECVPEVTGIRVRLQPGGFNYPIAGIEQAQEILSLTGQTGYQPDLDAALRFADELAAGLRDSPLRERAVQLQTALRRRLAGGR